MAELNQNVLGNVKGKLGNVVFRNLNGKTFISLRPVKYKKSKSAIAKIVRNGFKQVNLFSSTINKNTILKEIWNISDVKSRSAYNKIFKSNLNISPKSGITKLNIITPNRVELKPMDFSITESEIEVKFSSKLLMNKFNIYDEIYCFCLIFAFEPIKSSQLELSSQLLVLDKYSNIRESIIFFLKENIDLEYKNRLIFSSIVSLKDGKITNWSSTYSSEF